MLVTFLRLATGTGSGPSVPLTEDQWKTLLSDAKKHSLLGVISDAVLSLPENLRPSRTTKLLFAVPAEKIHLRNESIAKLMPELMSEMGELGLRCCLIKGQGLADLYPHPESRQSGDVDLWVRGTLKKTVQALRRKWEVREVYYHHTSIYPFGRKMEIEVHFRPTWMNNPFTDRKLQRYFTSAWDAKMVSGPVAGCLVPDIEFNLVFCAVHIYRHLLAEGIGLRQIMDYYLVLRHSTEEQRRTAFRILTDLLMKKFIGALMYVVKEVFDIEDRLLLCPVEPLLGRFLLDEILRSGNFGKYDDRNKYHVSDPLFIRIKARMTRLSRLIGIAPSEVIWAPVFKIWQHIWRRINKY